MENSFLFLLWKLWLTLHNKKIPKDTHVKNSFSFILWKLWKLWDFYFIQLLNLIEKITSTLEFDRKKHFKFLKKFENHRILDFKQLNLIEKITSNFEKFEKFEVLMRTLPCSPPPPCRTPAPPGTPGMSVPLSRNVFQPTQRECPPQTTVSSAGRTARLPRVGHCHCG